MQCVIEWLTLTPQRAALSGSRGRGRLGVAFHNRLSNAGLASGHLNLGALVLDDIVGLLFPLGGLGPLGVVPWAGVRVLTAARALAGAAKGLGEVLGGNLLEEFRLVATTEDVDLLDGDGVEPALDDAPDGGEAPGGVDDVQLAEALRVVVLGDDGG